MLRQVLLAACIASAAAFQPAALLSKGSTRSVSGISGEAVRRGAIQRGRGVRAHPGRASSRFGAECATSCRCGSSSWDLVGICGGKTLQEAAQVLDQGCRSPFVRYERSIVESCCAAQQGMREDWGKAFLAHSAGGRARRVASLRFCCVRMKELEWGVGGVSGPSRNKRCNIKPSPHVVYFQVLKCSLFFWRACAVCAVVRPCCVVLCRAMWSCVLSCCDQSVQA